MGVELSVVLGGLAEGDASEIETRRRRAYGRGLFDGLQMAGITDPGAFMNEAKQQRAEQALSGIEAKVFDCVPIETQWDRHLIVGEMRRKTGSNPDPHVVDGCLVDLLSRHLISEPAPGQFKRNATRPRVVVMPKAPAAANGTQPVSPHGTPINVGPPRPLIDVFADLSKKLRELADEFDAASLQVAGELQAHEQEADRFRQLQQLLKGMT